MKAQLATLLACLPAKFALFCVLCFAYCSGLVWFACFALIYELNTRLLVLLDLLALLGLLYLVGLVVGLLVLLGFAWHARFA